MAQSPALKVYDPNGKYIGSAKEVLGAAVMAQVYGEGSTIRLGHSRVLYTQGKDGDACESYDSTGALMVERAGEDWAPAIIY